MSEKQKREYIDADIIALMIDVSGQTVRRWAREGIIPAYKVGGQWRFSVDEVKAWMKESQATKQD